MNILASVILLTVLLLSAPAVNGEVAPPRLRSGVYRGSLFLAVDHEKKEVTGYFSSGSGEFFSDPWQCKFYFSGHLNEDGSAKILATMKDSVEGILSTPGLLRPDAGKEHAVLFNLDESLPGCERDESLTGSAPEAMTLTEEGNFIQFRIVSATRSYFYPSASSALHGKSYVTCGDIVKLLELKSPMNKSKVEFKGKRKVISGWLFEKDLLPVRARLVCK